MRLDIELTIRPEPELDSRKIFNFKYLIDCSSAGAYDTDTYSGGKKFVIFYHKLLFNTCYEQVFCFAQLLLQILVNYQSQGQFQNLLVLRIPKLTLEVKFDLNLPDLSKV